MAEPSEYIDWAIAQVSDNRDGQNLIILAGLNRRLETDEVEEYFLGACVELGVRPVAEHDWRGAANLIREAYVKGALGAREAISGLAQLYVVSQYLADEFSPWSDIEEELSMQGSEYTGVFYDPKYLVDLDALVEREWRLYEALRHHVLSGHLRSTNFCVCCGSIGPYNPVALSMLERFFQGKRNVAGRAPHACSECGSRDSRPLSDPDAREDYFKRRGDIPNAPMG